MNEPIADAVRSILDGHVVLTRELAHAGHYPAVDVLQSRLAPRPARSRRPTWPPPPRRPAPLLAAWHDKRDLIAIGAYERGSDPLVDRALELKPAIDDFLRQAVDAPSTPEEADDALLSLLAGDVAAGLAAEVAAEVGARAGPVRAGDGLSAVGPRRAAAAEPRGLAVVRAALVAPRDAYCIIEGKDQRSGVALRAGPPPCDRVPSLAPRCGRIRQRPGDSANARRTTAASARHRAPFPRCPGRARRARTRTLASDLQSRAGARRARPSSPPRSPRAAAGLASAGAPGRRRRPACADRLPLDTLLRVPDGPRRPRPLILALHGARQSGYGLQSYTGFTDDAPGYLVAYPNTPHDNGFWDPDDVPALLALVDAIGRCEPVTERERRRLLQRRPDGQRAGLPRGAADAGDRARRLGLRGPRALRAGRAGVGALDPRLERPGRGLSRPARLRRHVGAARSLRARGRPRAGRSRGSPTCAGTAARRARAWSTCASPTTPTAGRRSRTPTSAWCASCAPWVEARRSALVHRAGHGSGRMMGARRLNRDRAADRLRVP